MYAFQLTQLLVEGNYFEVDALKEFESYELYLQRNEQLRRNSRIETAAKTELEDISE